MPLLGSPRTRVPSTAGSGAHSLRAPQRADPWSESPATGAQVRRGKEPGLGRVGGGRGSSRSQWKDRETISSEVCHVGSTRPPAPPLRAQPAAAPSLGRGPGTRVRWRTRRPGAALPGPPSSHLHACDQREGRRGQREPPVPQAARLHTQRCPQPRAAGAPPATRWALGRRMRGSASGSAAMG